MSSLALLIVASLIAALAFFGAGMLLARPRPKAEAPVDGEVTKDVRELIAAEAQQQEIDDLRSARTAALRERDEARTEAARHAAEEKKLAERLRTAEDANRAAFDREEKAAETWAAQLDAAKAVKKRHEEELEHELGEARGRIEHAEDERAQLARTVQAAETAAEAALDRAQASDATVQQTLARLEEAKAREAEARSARAATEARAQELLARVEHLETATRAQRTAAEAVAQAELASQQANLEAQLAAVEAKRSELAQALELERSERANLTEQLERDKRERKTLEGSREEMELRVRAAEEVVELLRGQVASLNESVRVGDLRAKDRERLQEENADLRARVADAEREEQTRTGREEESKDARVELAAAQAKLAELDRVVDENRRLRDEAAELRAHQEASSELERLQAEHKQVRLDAELMARRLQELLRDRTELESLRTQAADAAALGEEVEYLRRREKDLEAQLYASGSFASREMPVLSGELPVVTPITDLETNLSVLVGHGSARTAVLADRQGFLIASAGESVAEEGLAAFAAVAGEMVTRARMLLPLADVGEVRVVDANRMVLTCHLFQGAGEQMGVATLGPAEPAAENTTRAIAAVAAIVDGSDAADAAVTPEPEPSG